MEICFFYPREKMKDDAFLKKALRDFSVKTPVSTMPPRPSFHKTGS